MMKMNWANATACMVLVGLLAGCSASPGGGGGQAVAPVPTEAAMLEGEAASPAAEALFLVDGVSAELDDIEDGFILTRVDAYLAEDATVAQINAALEELDGVIVGMAPGSQTLTMHAATCAAFPSRGSPAPTATSFPLTSCWSTAWWPRR